MMCLYLEAPFAVCRTFTAGWYRPTAAFITPSAAYGLILNIAGIESRLREEDVGHDGRTPASLIRLGLPEIRVALGLPADKDGGKDRFPTIESIYQQLHNYPVGKDAGMPKELSKGNKNNITPVRRELLCNLRALICLDGNIDLEAMIRKGLKGDLNANRYGLPFLGDNQFLIDRLEERTTLQPAQWYEKLDRESEVAAIPGTTRLTVWVNRADMSKTISHLFVPTREPTPIVPEAAWTTISPP